MIRVTIQKNQLIERTHARKDKLNKSFPGEALGSGGRVAAAGAALGALVSGNVKADVPATPDQSTMATVEITGTAISSERDISQSVDTIDKKELAEQNLALVQDALRNVPGITLNSGEGGSHGDSVNLRGLSIPDSFFLDGVRDIGQYQRDTFNTEAISVLLGPASALFGRGSTSGVINSISKQPLLTPLAAVSVSGGQADYFRGTGDFNLPLGDTAAARLAVMDQSNGVVQRDEVHYKRYGVAPTLAFGIDTPTRTDVELFQGSREQSSRLRNSVHRWGSGARRPQQLLRSGQLRSHAHQYQYRHPSLRARLQRQHHFSDSLAICQLRVRVPGHRLVPRQRLRGPATAGTPLADIEISRDQPSSAGTTSLLINRSDVTTKFDVAGFKNTLVSGLELSKEQSNVQRFKMGWTTSLRPLSWRPIRSIRRRLR
jgi:catecholate siderophore receptor